MTLPYNYKRLGPFREAFRTGVPILCYHHIAPPRRGARLKWLYVPPKIFARQIAELQSAGFSTPEIHTVQTLSGRFAQDSDAAAPASAALPTKDPGEASLPLSDSPPAPHETASKQTLGNPQSQVVLTFDDGFRDVFDHALPLLRQNRLRSIAFLVSDMLGKSNEWQQILGDVVEPLMDEAQIREWLASGQEIGSHTKSHPWLTHLSLDAAREQITASKKSLEDRFGVRIDHFCYPYGDWNQAVRDLIIEADYKTACTTHPGINTPQTPLFELKRYLARHRTRTLKTIWQRLRVHLGLTTPAKTPGTSGRIEN